MRTLILIVIVVALAYAMRAIVGRLRAAEEAPSKDPDNPQLPSPWRAVTIRTGDPACMSARRLEGKRFLLDEAPELPLAECDVEHCSCTFSHFDDRRTGSERRDFYDIRNRGAHASTDGEKRQGEDRRDG